MLSHKTKQKHSPLVWSIIFLKGYFCDNILSILEFSLEMNWITFWNQNKVTITKEKLS